MTLRGYGSIRGQDIIAWLILPFHCPALRFVLPATRFWSYGHSSWDHLIAALSGKGWQAISSRHVPTHFQSKGILGNSVIAHRVVI
jgi:hypothetical protein